MSWFKKAQNNISIDMSGYINQISGYLNTFISVPLKKNEYNNLKKSFINNLQSFINNDSIKNNEININALNSFLNKILQNEDKYIIHLEKFLSNLYFSLDNEYKYKQKIRELWRQCADLEVFLNNSYFSEKDKEDTLKDLINQSSINMELIKNDIEKSISIIKKVWNNSFITIIAETEYDNNGSNLSIDEGTSSAYIHIGDKSYYLNFGVNIENNNLNIWDDGVEDTGEIIEEFGDGAKNPIQDFINLKNIIKNPDFLLSKGKNIKVYTARPVKDFELYNNASKVPVNIFVSTKYDFVEGFARDYSPRDIWEIKINNKYLMDSESNNAGQTYQTFNSNGDSFVPIEKINYINRVNN